VEQVIVTLVIAAAVPLTLRWIARGGAPRGQPGILAYGGRARLFAAFFCVVPSLLFAAVFILARREGSDGLGAVLGMVFFFPALSLPLALEFYRVSIRYDADGLHVASPWSRRRSLRWSEITSARWRPTVKWFDLSDGKNVVHISPLLTGFESFAAVCRASLPDGAKGGDGQVSSVLNLMEQGRAHELVWGNESPSNLLMRRP
jgi:hypothetical protein